ncbi:MAG: IS21 family transposase [Bacteroidales bacterium]|nr:IS21 family transposase [Bacteroidales bacterium]
MNRYLNKLIMYHEIHQMNRQGYSVSYIASCLVINWRTVKKYLSMDEREYEDFINHYSNRKKGLNPYKHFVKVKLEQYPNTSASQMHDWLKEHYNSFPKVNPKTVYNFVMWVRQEYNIPKVNSDREYFIVEELPYGKQSQVDFGEYNIRTGTGKRKKVYFFTMVLSRSRYKYVYFSDTPFTTALSIAAHEKAFEYFQGIPKEIVYDQDKVFMVDENKGDLVLTEAFQNYVKQRAFGIYFCRKADPESKGKVENVVKYVKQNFLYNRTYFDLDTLNNEVLGWMGRTANYLHHSTTKASPYDQWIIEKNHLSAYVPVINQMDDAKYYTVRKDNTISYKSNLYSLPQGTWNACGGKVIVSEKDGYIIINHSNGIELCRHKKSNKKGQTIINTDHKRDKTERIDKMIIKEAERFEHKEKAIMYFEKIRKEKPRYIRDQIIMIREAFNIYLDNAINKALEYCLDNHIYSASDFESVANKFNNELEDKNDVKSSLEIKTLPNSRNNIKELKPSTSKILDYESLMPN